MTTPTTLAQLAQQLKADQQGVLTLSSPTLPTSLTDLFYPLLGSPDTSFRISNVLKANLENNEIALEPVADKSLQAEVYGICIELQSVVFTKPSKDFELKIETVSKNFSLNDLGAATLLSTSSIKLPPKINPTLGQVQFVFDSSSKTLSIESEQSTQSWLNKPYTLNQIKLQITLSFNPTHKFAPVYNVFVEGDFDLDKQPIKARIYFPNGLFGWRLQISGQHTHSIQLGKLLQGELFQALKITYQSGDLPADLLGSVELAWLEIAFDISPPKFRRLDTIITTSADWNIAGTNGDILKICAGAKLSLFISHNGGSSFSGSIEGTAAICKLPVTVRVPLPISSGNSSLSTHSDVKLQNGFQDLLKLTGFSGEDFFPHGFLSAVGGLSLTYLALEFTLSPFKFNNLQFTVAGTKSWALPGIKDGNINQILMDLSLVRDSSGKVSPSGQISGILTIDSINVGVVLSKSAGQNWTLAISSDNITLPGFSSITNLIEGTDLSKTLPAQASTVDTIVLSNLGLQYAFGQPKPLQYVSFYLNDDPSSGGWQLDKQFTLNTFGLGLTIDRRGGNDQTSASMSASATVLKTGQARISANYDSTAGWVFEGTLDNLNITQLVQEVEQVFSGVTVPADIVNENSIVLNHLDIKYETNPHQKSKAFTFTLNGTLKEQSKNLTIALNVNLVTQSGSTNLTLDGQFNIGSRYQFAIHEEHSSKSSLLKATYKGSTLLSKLLSELDVQVDLPHALNPTISQIDLVYDFKQKQFVFDCATASHGALALIGFSNGKTSEYIVGIKLGESFKYSLTELPLIGTELPKDMPQVALHDIHLLLCTQVPVSQAIVGQLIQLDSNMLSGLLPANGIKHKLSFGLIVDLGGKTKVINYGAESAPPSADIVALTDASIGESDHSNRAVVLAPSVGAAGESVPTKWFNIQKTVGPLAISQIGLRYQDGKLFVLANISLTGAGLTIEPLGLGVGSPLNKFDPTFTIDGLDVRFGKDPLLIEGGLFGSLHPNPDFVGELMLHTSKLSLAAVGGYAEYHSHPSLFAYLLLDVPLGGPPFFFVEGLALGFGYNRKLLLPDLKGVSDFPFVAWALDTSSAPQMDFSDPKQSAENAITELTQKNIVPISVGDYWIAAGVKFTSFKIVESFALLTVSFGHQFEIDIVGLSELKMPYGAETPIFNAELALKARFAPAEGVLSVQAQLTDRSYILSPDARLTGGFAFFTWFGSNPHAGDIVLTLGGYSPFFSVPDYYPTVPRLGVNWPVTSELTIKGGIYFALTSNAIMAGTEVSAVWQSSHVRAWFDFEAHFLMLLQPFHYFAEIGIHLGASFTVDVGITTLSKTIHLGVGLTVWGPDFSGIVRVDLDIISFSIRFGNASQNTKTKIGWQQFVAKVLPGAGGSGSAVDAPANGATSTTNSRATIAVTDGLTKQVTVRGVTYYVVNPETVTIETSSVIPSKQVSLNGTFHDLSSNRQFGNRATGTANEHFVSKHQVTVKKDDSSPISLDATPVFGKVPKSLWGVTTYNKHGTPDLDPDALKNATICNVITGVIWRPPRLTPDQTLPIALQNLQYTIDPHIQGVAWSAAHAPADGPISGKRVSSTIKSATATTNRSGLFTALADLDLGLDTNINVDNLASKPYLMAKPLMTLLGDNKKG